MSTLKVGGIRGVSASSDAITVSNDGTCTANVTNNLSNRNIVINGAMQVAQRDTGSGFTGVGQQEYTIDRFVTLHSYNSSTINVINSSQSPDGFSKSYKVDVTAADTSIGAAEFMFIRHKIEAQNLQQLAYGTSGAKSITLSFYVRSNVTGTYAICLQQKDNSSKQVNGTYTINSANTWERKTFNFAGDTTGVINNDNGHGLDILWTLVAGSDRTSGSARPTWTTHANADESVGHTANILSSTSNDWHLTGVQLEVDHTGSGVATDFEHRSFAQELALCQRYFNRYNTETVNGHFFLAAGYNNSNPGARGSWPFTVPMRASPSLAISDLSHFAELGTGKAMSSITLADSGTGKNLTGLTVTFTSNSFAGFAHVIRAGNTSAYLQFDAEL
tara:strand:+ start:150 stop:1316 length:1167 start_codon:yes stop_codon:yes gene_type:complete